MLGLKQSLGIAKKKTATAAGSSFADDYSILLDGTNDYVNLADAASEVSGVTGSISFWFKSPNTGGYPFEIKVDTNNFIVAYYAYDVMNTQRRCAGSNNSATAFSDGSGDDGNWHHLALTWSETADRLISYADGSAETTTTGIETSFAGTPSIFTIGKHSGHWSGGYMSGNINDVSVWSSALSAGEVAAIYNSGTPTDLSSEDDLVGYWKFEENTGTTVADSSDNSNDGALVNGTAWSSTTP